MARSKRKEEVTCTVCGTTYEISRTRWLQIVASKQHVVCKSCAQSERDRSGAYTSYNRMEDLTSNGRKCRHCGKPLWGGWWLNCPDCLEMLETNDELTSSEYTGHTLQCVLKDGIDIQRTAAKTFDDDWN